MGSDHMRLGPRLGDPERVHQQPLERQAPPQMGLRPPPSRELDDVVSISGTLTHTYGQPLLERPKIWQICPKLGSWSNGNCVSRRRICVQIRLERRRTTQVTTKPIQNWFAWRPYLALGLGQNRPLGGAKGPLGGANTHPPCVFCARRVYWTLPLAYVLCGNTTGHGTEGPIWGCSVENSASPHTAGVFGIRPRGARCDETSVRG
jgi:hypothetical protein